MNKYLSYSIVGIAGIFILLLISSILQSAFQPRPVYWGTHFSKASKDPYGTKVFQQQLYYLFPGKKIKRLTQEDLPYYFEEEGDIVEYEIEDENDDFKVENSIDSSALKKRAYENSLPYDELEEQHEEERIESIINKADPIEESTISDSVSTFKIVADSSILNLNWDKLMKESFQGSNEIVKKPTWLEQFEDIDLDTSFNLIGISSTLKGLEWQSKGLVYHVSKGNYAYLSFQHYPQKLKKLLGFSVTSNSASRAKYEFDNSKTNKTNSVSELLDWAEKKEEKVEALPHVFNFTFENGHKFQLDSIDWVSYFDIIPKNAEVLGRNDSGKVVLFKLKIGHGTLIMSTLPHLFSNYEILKKDNKIAEDEILRLPNRDTYYFENLKMGGSTPSMASPSLLTYIHKQPPLAWAFYLLMFGLGIFLFLQIFRIERAIPIHNPPQNLSLGYIRTLSDLFYRKKDNRLIIKRKMEYFKHVIESQYHLDTRKLDTPFFKKLASHTGVSQKEVTQLFKIYESMESQKILQENKFQAFNKLMQLFKK